MLSLLLLVSKLISLFYNIITVLPFNCRSNPAPCYIKWLMASLTLHKTQLVRL